MVGRMGARLCLAKARLGHYHNEAGAGMPSADMFDGEPLSLDIRHESIVWIAGIQAYWTIYVDLDILLHSHIRYYCFLNSTMPALTSLTHSTLC